MQSITRVRVGWLLFGAILFGVGAGCHGKDAGNKAKADDVALAKPAEDATAKPLVPPPPAPPLAAKEKGGEVVSNDAPSADDGDSAGAEPDGEDADEGKSRKGSKKKRSKTRKHVARNRSSSGDKDDAAPKHDAADHQGAIKLKRIQFAHAIHGREPVEPEETFSASETEKLYAFIELTNDTKEKAKVFVTFVPPQGSASKVPLDVGDKPRWRTWAMRKAPKAVGTWKVVVRDESGRELGHRTFEVTE